MDNETIMIWLMLTFFSLFFSLAHTALKYHDAKGGCLEVVIDFFYWGCWLVWVLFTGSLVYKFLNSAFEVVGKALQ